MLADVPTYSSVASSIAASSATPASVNGVRKNGKQWKSTKTAFRPGKSASKGWDERQADRKTREATKAREKGLKEEKEAERAVRIQQLKEKREKKEEKERFDKLAAKMHAKRVERLRRREKRNKALKER